MIRVCIVIPVHNRRDITLLCLKSLDRVNKENLEVKIIIVDDGSTDGTPEAILKNFPEVEVIHGDGSLWYTEGTNVGVRAALKYNPKYVLLMNDDQVFDKNFLKYMVETAEKNEKSVVGALLLLWDQPHKVFQVSPIWSTWLGGWHHWRHQTVWTVPKTAWEVELIVGNCVLVPTKAIEELGLMNSKYFPNFGDAEYTPRLRKNGWKLILDPRAKVFVQPNTTPQSVKRLSSFREKLEALFVDLKKPQNVRRRFYAYWLSAPSKIQGVIAFFIFFVRLLLGKNIEGDWAEKQKEPPLSELLRDKILVDQILHQEMKVIYSWNYTEWGGAQVYFLSLMKEVLKKSQVEVIMPKNHNQQLTDILKSLGVKYKLLDSATDNLPAENIICKIKRHYRKFRSEINFYRSLKQTACEKTIFHVDFAPWQSFLFLYFLSRKNKVFFTVHNPASTSQSWRRLLWKVKFKLLQKRRNFYLLASNQLSKKWLKDSYGIEAELVYSGVDLQEIEEAIKKEESSPTKTDQFKVLCAGQFIDRKGRWEYLQAAKEILQESSDTTFIWLSNSTPSEEDLKRISEYSLGTHFVLISADKIPTRKDYLKLLSEADIFVLPSRKEGLPIAIIEAMALGKPVISTNIDAIPEAVIDGVSGLLVSPQSPKELAQAIKLLKSNKNLREELSKNAMLLVAEKFDMCKISQKMIEIYENS